jgi:MSHA biogenesis protein MshN
VAAASQPVAALHGKPLLLVASEDEPVAVPEVRKNMRKQAQHRLAASAEPDDGQEMENPELLKKISPQQRAESEFLKANLAVQEGRTTDALKGYESALLIDPTFKPARRAWVAALVGLKRNDEAEPVLKRGLKRDSHDATFAMMLARLQVERDAVQEALETLQKTLPFADGQADYRAFVAALLQRLGRHDEAVEQYRAVLKIAPNNGVWWMGLGISLQALQHTEEARETYQRALATNSLNPQLQAFVQQKLKEL